MSKTVTVHTIVQNEEKYLWFSVMSIIDFVDEVFIWDTGSTDNTVPIIKEIKKLYPNKIYFKEVGMVDPDKFTSIRQEMLRETTSDWLMIVDGDEVWWNDRIREVVSIINQNGNSLDTIVNRYINLVGDIYHFQDDSAGRDNIDGKTGYLTVRAMNRKIEGLDIGRPHGQQGFFNGNGVLIQDMEVKKRHFLDKFTYLHFTNLPRSRSSFAKDVPKRMMKYKYELGDSFPPDFYYPEVFFRPRPKIIESPWVARNSSYFLRASIETPLKNIKRNLIPNKKSGY